MKKLLLIGFICLFSTTALADPYTCEDLKNAVNSNDNITLQNIANEVDFSLQQNWPAIYADQQSHYMVARLVGGGCGNAVQDGMGDTTIPAITNLIAQDLARSQ